MKYIQYEREHNISYIYLNRPEQYNALNESMLKQLLQVIEKVEENNDRVVIISGKGKAFSAGGDMAMLKEFTERDVYDRVMETIESIVKKLYMMPKVVISAINGTAVGLGLSLALAADHVVSYKHATFGVLFLGVGLAPDGGGHFWLSERLGVQKAKQFTWSMDQVDGDEAYQMGLIDVVTEKDIVEVATSMGQHIHHSPIQALLTTKEILHKKRLPQLEAYLAEEREAQWALRQTKDHREGVEAFLEKRQPKFIGE